MHLFDWVHHPYISTGFGGKHFYSPCYIKVLLIIIKVTAAWGSEAAQPRLDYWSLTVGMMGGERV